MTDMPPWWNGYTHVVAVLVVVIELFIEGYCLYRLVKPFLQRIKPALAAGGIYFLTMLGLYVMPPHIGIFSAYAMGSLAVFLVMCVMERRNYSQKAFLAATYYSLRWFTAAMADILYDYLYDLVEDTAWFQGNPPMHMQFMVYVGVSVFYLIMLLVITVGGTYCIIKSYVYKYERMSKQELLMLVIPPFLGVVGYKMIRHYRTFYILESGELPRSYDLLALFYCGVAVTVVVIMIVLYQNIKAVQEEKLENQMLSVQIDNLKRHIGQVENLYQDIRGMKHDMTNHILTLERLYAGSETKEAKDYVRDLKAVLIETMGDVKSGNPVTDVILQEWKNEAEKKGICFKCDFHYPAESNINVFDVSVILNNALQNAVENTVDGETAQISASSYRRNNVFMIEISNSFTGNLQWDTECGLPLTSKGKAERRGYGQMHGYGLSNIRKVAGKYFGDIDIVLKNGEFLLSVMLMMG